MAPGEQLGVRCLYPGFSSTSVTGYRRVKVILGSPSVRSDGFLCVVHLCAGNDGGFSSSSYASALVVGSERHPAEHQCYGCHFSPASGQNGVSCPVSHGCRGTGSSLDRVSFGLPDSLVYSGEVPCFGGSTQSSSSDSSQRMVPFFRGF